MDKSWITKPRTTMEFREGLVAFLDFAMLNASQNGKIKCPCNGCCFRTMKLRDEVLDDVIFKGWPSGYTTWFFHGEEVDPVPNNPMCESAARRLSTQGPIHTLLEEAFGVNAYDIGERSSSTEEHVGAEQVHGIQTEEEEHERRRFNDLLRDGKELLYDGISDYSKLEFILKLYHIKVLCGISDKGLSMILEMLKDVFKKAKFPDSFNDAKRTINKLGLNYEKKHACPNDCMLYWENDEKRDNCKTCGTSRWKENKKQNPVKKSKRVPAKILRYFPLIPRLQRIFMSTKLADNMRWHASNKNMDGLLRHPRDGKAWKTFDQLNPLFASDPRNIRLGLATDGFNPFGSMSTNYSIWPVMLIPYNLPPWMYMKQTSKILSMIIPGKKMPGNDLDVYLQPLIKELMELWNGVETYDASARENFTMHAALMWTISDFPGLDNLSGWNTHTQFACPSCNFETVSRRLKNKWCFMGHRRFLQVGHRFRLLRRQFDGCTESRIAPDPVTGSEILSQLEGINFSFGKQKTAVDIQRKRKHRDKDPIDDTSKQWRKKSIFFTLPYWKTNLLRHCLDVMHIEKNICDNILGTLLNEKEKTKDNLKARKDLQDMGIRPELWPDDHDKFLPSCFTMTNVEKDVFFNFLKSVRVPDGYASNISRCLDIHHRKIFSLKSHDCHILMQQLLPLVLRKVLPKKVSSVLIELCSFFRELCSKVLKITDLTRLKLRIASILCHMEMIFPPAFFTIMVYLSIHLPDEAILGGPVQSRWMYPFERCLGHFRRTIRNYAHPEASMAEAYISEECLTFASLYLEDIETKFNRSSRNDDRNLQEDVAAKSTPLKSCFPRLGKAIGSAKPRELSRTELIQAHRYILFNCQAVNSFREKYACIVRRMFRHRRGRKVQAEIEKYIHMNFAKWFQNHIENESGDNISDEIRYLAAGPCKIVVTFDGYNINGFKFRTVGREIGLKTQNSGVVVTAKTSSFSSFRDVHPVIGDVAYYGKLIDIVEVDYYGAVKVLLFKCDWVDSPSGRGLKKDDYGFTLVNFNRLLYPNLTELDEPFVFASQSKQVFYVEDPIDTEWNDFVPIIPRDLYDMGSQTLEEQVEEQVHLFCENELYPSQDLTSIFEEDLGHLSLTRLQTREEEDE